MAKRFVSNVEQSKIYWGNHVEEDEYPGNDRIKLGCLQRIASAAEAMAKNHVQLQSDYNYMRESRDRYKALYEKEAKRSAAFKGWVTRYKANKK